MSQLDISERAGNVNFSKVKGSLGSAKLKFPAEDRFTGPQQNLSEPS